jgi:5-dehydro-2-deoxygluconokinase
MPLAQCCEIANACGAIVVSRHACAPAMPSWEELQVYLDGEWPARLRESQALEQIHWSSTRLGHYDELTVLAIDHRSQFEDMVGELGIADKARISAFKGLALRAVDLLAHRGDNFGILLDDRFGARALEAAADRPYWIGRPIEDPGSRPLAFEGSADVGVTLRAWPAGHVAKCLVFYHPDDPKDLREAQDRQVLRLADACRATRRELLLEIIASRHGPMDDTTVARVIDHFYSLGVYPDWWKLEASDDPAAWANIEKAIERHDPHCRGVLLLGLSAPEDELLAGFATAASFRVVKGFAVGRTIFHDVAVAWLAGEIDDDQAVARLAANFDTLVKAWRRMRAERAAA